MALEVVVDGIVLTIRPDYGRHCWKFNIVYSCGHPVTEQTCSHVRNKVILVKENNHRGPCWIRNCIVATQTHTLPEKCHRCDMWDVNNVEGRHS
ncbi:uncharacterized protein GGS25DRAFT_476656 [Hypoxylon fragiforme]|uniref:uncharacterized protein n=1 Tax=Hypoxylon fragiforme TaxID=63214 RepID=UPI0020C6DECD|nr:uncharacterized protein GGS25DRAFT_476656 [Hypoxylon fragiforme]KAI2612695.1 hypothetical protein GGS25DRAFT_476656 [Hypoxylon fragiforme]